MDAGQIFLADAGRGRPPDREGRPSCRQLFIIIWALGWAFTPFSLGAQTTTSSDALQPSEKVRRIEEAYIKDLEDLRRRLGVVEAQQSHLVDEMAQHIKVGAYGLVSFESFKDRQTTNDGKLELLISGNLSNRIRVYNEIDFGVPNGTAEAEQAYVDFLIEKPINFRAGVLLIPFGKFNLDHFDPRRDFTDRPVVARRIVPTTWSDLGFSLFGLLSLGSSAHATYEVQVVNGLTDAFTATAQAATPAGLVDQGLGLRGAKSELFRDNNGDKAVVARTTLKFLDQYEFGFSGYRGKYKPSGGGEITAFSADLEWKPRGAPIWENFEVRSEFSRFDIAGSTAPSSLWGHYTQINYKFWPSFLNDTFLGRSFSSPTFTLLGLYGHSQINSTVVADGSLYSDEFRIGLNYRPMPDYVVKGEYQFNAGQLERGSADGFLFSVAWIF